MLNDIEIQDVNEILADIDYKLIQDKTFFVTGATGSLARYIVHCIMHIILAEEDDKGQVYILARDVKKAEKCFGDYIGSHKFTVIEGTIEEFVFPNRQLDYIFHAACVSSSSYAKTNPVEILSSNLVGTYNVLELAKKTKVKSLLFFSSGAVYGGATKNDSTYNGIDPLNTNNCYALGKQVGENLCAAYHKEYGVPAKIVRIGYTYGPYMDLNDGHLYSDFMKAILDRQDIVIKGDGESYIGLCYITDAVRAFLRILFYGENAKSYVMRNWAERMTIKEIARKLTEEVFWDFHLGYTCLKKGPKQEKIEVCPSRELVSLGWTPLISLNDGFERTLMSIERNNL